MVTLKRESFKCKTLAHTLTKTILILYKINCCTAAKTQQIQLKFQSPKSCAFFFFFMSSFPFSILLLKMDYFQTQVLVVTFN